MFGNVTLGKKCARFGARKSRFEPLEDRRLLSRTILVDDDKSTFRNAQFTSIQAAVDAANAGDTILVGPGSYKESVTVTKKLTIQGMFAAGSAATNPRIASIVDPLDSGDPINPSLGFNLLANNITIQGFTIGDLDGEATAVGDGTVGIETSPLFSGYKIVSNEILDNVIGIYLNSSGQSTSSVLANRIHNNNVEGPAGGNGIYSDQGAGKVNITGNTIRNQDNSAILFLGFDGVTPFAVPVTGITIQGNVVGSANKNDSGSPIIFADVLNSTINANTLFESNGSAVALTGGCSNITVQANTIISPEFTGVNVANLIELDNANINNSILSNTIVNAGADGGSGIRIRGDASGNIVKGNVVTGTKDFDPITVGYGSGITLEDTAHDNRIESNTLTNNARDGIFADIGTFDNSIKKNVALQNGNFDLEDLSLGIGTAGTANTWSGNTAKKKSPGGLK